MVDSWVDRDGYFYFFNNERNITGIHMELAIEIVKKYFPNENSALFADQILEDKGWVKFQYWNHNFSFNFKRKLSEIQEKIIMDYKLINSNIKYE